MVSDESIIIFFSEFWQMDIASFTLDIKFDNKEIDNFTSLRFLQFIAAIESNFDFKFDSINELTSMRDLVKIINE